jgi:hypothetical protein
MINLKYNEERRDFSNKIKKADFVSSNQSGQYALVGMCGCQH